MDFTFDPINFCIVEGPSFDAHLGRRILTALKKDEHKIHQIDVATGEEETCGSFRLRTIRMAQSLKERGLKVGDVVVLCGMYHNDLTVPFVACQYLGLTPVGLAVGMTKAEVKHFLSIARPKIVFSDPSMTDVIEETLKNLDIKAEVVIFGDVNKGGRHIRFCDLIKSFSDEEDFRCVDFNPNETVSWAGSTSGSSGMPKIFTVTHRVAYILTVLPYENDKPLFYNISYLHFSPLYWASGIHPIIGSCLIGYTRMQSSKQYSLEILKNAVEKYKPPVLLLAPAAILSLLKDPSNDEIIFTCIETLFCGGSSLPCQVFADFQKFIPNAIIKYLYGSGEMYFISCNQKSAVIKSVGKIYDFVQWKIVDVDTRKTLGVNQTGEFCVKNLTMFKEYMNDPVSTANTFDEEGFFKTGDLVYYDDVGDLCIVDRIKEMIKYRDCQISPIEIEDLVCTLPEVLKVCVVAIRHPIDIERPVAFVQLVPGAKVSAQKIKDLVSETLSSYKSLTGGVVFVDQLPMTHSAKVDRKAIKALVAKMKSE